MAALAAGLAAAAPLVEALAPTVINLITSLVHQHAPVAEAVMGSGTGPVKFADVFVNVMSDLAKAKANGTLADAIPSDAVVKAVIQAVVTSMKISGMLTGAPPPAVPSAPSVPAPIANQQTIRLAPGQTLTISA